MFKIYTGRLSKTDFKVINMVRLMLLILQYLVANQTPALYFEKHWQFNEF